MCTGTAKPGHPSLGEKEKIRTWLMRARLLVVLVLVGYGLATPPESATVPEFWYASDSSPLRFDFPQTGRGVDNADLVVVKPLLRKIVGYELGCVRTRNGLAEQTSAVRTYDLDYPVETQTVPVKVLGVLSKRCKGNRLAITKVKFADGSLWLIPPASGH